MLAELGTISTEPDRLIRLFLTPEHRRAADLVARWMRDAGHDVSEDALGTVRGRRRQAAEAAADRFAHRHGHRCRANMTARSAWCRHPGGGAFRAPASLLPFGIDVLAFGDEEGSRFPATLSSSSACAGCFRPRSCSSRTVTA